MVEKLAWPEELSATLLESVVLVVVSTNVTVPVVTAALAEVTDAVKLTERPYVDVEGATVKAIELEVVVTPSDQ